MAALLLVAALLGASATSDDALTAPPLNLDAQSLPRNFQGTDVVKLVIAAKQERGEFESTAEFTTRMAALVNPARQYAFVLPSGSVDFTYDADRERFEAAVKSYGGSFQLGSETIRGTQIIYELGDEWFAKRAPVAVGIPRESAKKLKDALALLVVVSFREPREGEKYVSAYMHNTTSGVVVWGRLNADVQQVWIFDRSSGRVLAKSDVAAQKADEQKQERVLRETQDKETEHIKPSCRALRDCEREAANSIFASCPEQRRAFEAACEGFDKHEICANPPRPGRPSAQDAPTCGDRGLTQ